MKKHALDSAEQLKFDFVENIVIVQCDEWEGLYIDGKCVDQGHTIPLRTLVEAVGGVVKTLSNEGEDVLMDEGYLPDALKDVLMRRI